MYNSNVLSETADDMIPNDFNTAHAEILKLVQTFADNHDKYHEPTYNESAARTDFIDKFFIALGWDVKHDHQTNPYEQEVKIERNVAVAQRVKKADYAFFLAPNFRQERFFVEAKRPSAPVLETPDNCFQVNRYAYSSAKAAISLLTNFKELCIIDCRFEPDILNASKRVYKKFYYADFNDNEKFAEIYYLFGRDAVVGGSLEKFAESLPKPKGKGKQRVFRADGYQDVDDRFLAQLEGFRLALAQMFKRKNTQLTSEDLTEAVQRTLDRLVFIRFLEDKLIEPSTILDKFGNKPHAWKQFIAKCREFDKTYNGIIFKQNPLIDADSFAVDDSVFLKICNDFSDKYTPYHFNYIPIHILGSIYERFLGNVIVATAKRATVEAKPEVRKAGGVFYTPQYIVNYIVENTVGALLGSVPPAVAGGAESVPPAVAGGLTSNTAQVQPPTTVGGTDRKRVNPSDVAKMRFADIACGSGSFLLGVYEYLLKWHTTYYNEKASKKEAREAGCIVNDDGTFHLSFEQKKEILVNNVYGVDIDRQAYEVTQLSLFLKLLEDETGGSTVRFLTGHRESLLPTLTNNIVCGNALVDWDITGGDLFEQLDADKERKLNPMSFSQKFPEIMRNGGFDAIVGNPPYVRQEQLGDLKDYFKKKYEVYHGVADLYTYFLERYFQILHPNGSFGIIVSNNWMRINFGEPLRKYLKKKDILEIIDFGDLPVFTGVAAYPCILRVTNRLADETFNAVNAKTLDFRANGLSDYVARNSFTVNQLKLSDSGWNLTDEARQDLLFKLRAGGTPLSNYVNGKIYRGVLTGLNEAFVIDEEIKERIIAQDPRSAEIIKPFLAGRDIKRFTKPNASKYLIFMPKGWTNNQMSGRSAWQWLQESYPSIAKYLSTFSKAAEARGDKGDYWWELRACDYYDKFDQAKLIYPNISKQPEFTFDDSGDYTNQKCFIIPQDDKYLLGVLNSGVTRFLYQQILPKLQGNFYEPSYVYLKDFPIREIEANNTNEKALHDLIVRSVDQIMEAKKKLAAAANERDRDFWTNKCDKLESDIDTAVYKLYDLTPDEIALIENA